MIADSQHLGAVLLHQEASELVADFSIAPRSEHLAWTRLFHDKKLPCNPILCHGRIFVLTETDNDKYTVIELTLEGQELRTIVPEQGASIRQLVVAQGRIYVSYLEQTTPRIRVLSSNGDDLGFVDTPSGGSVQLLMNYSETESDCLYTYESFDKDLSILEYIAKTGSSRLWHQRPSATIRRDFNVRNVTFRSKDDTSVPLTLVSFDVAKQNRPRPVIMTTYGGFGVSLTPQFSVLVAMMMEHGAVFALPHVRGGGEYGKPWHDSGRARNRQNSADDFIAAAEWLCERHVTTPKQIAAFGGSNSGLLVGAALTQRPELFGAVLCIAPLLDMVRYESFDQAVKWRREYGTINDPEDFRALHAFSPYHRVGDDIDYPSALFVTGDKDDRCNPAHARKMAARLQDRNAQKAPVIVDHSEQRGHSPVLPLSVRVDALARRVAFLCNELRIIPTKEGLHEALHP
jgi:prolyl oligopeptidase